MAKILLGHWFRKLRKEYADLGDVKLDIIEKNAEKGKSIHVLSFQDFDNDQLSRSTEYFVKYSKLLEARDKWRKVYGVSLATAGFAWFIKKVSHDAKVTRTLEGEYYRGREETYEDIEKYVESRGGRDSWIKDTIDGKHMVVRLTDDETDDYKKFHEYFNDEDGEIVLLPEHELD